MPPSDIPDIIDVMTSIDPAAEASAPLDGATPLTVVLSSQELAGVDAWREGQADKPSRPEAIRRLAAQALQRAEEDLERRRPGRSDRRKAVRLGGRRSGEE